MRIVTVNLDQGTVNEQPFACTDLADVGKGLAARLAAEHRAGCLVLAPGLLVGTAVPSTCRLSLAGVCPGSSELLLANTPGPFAQKLAGLDIAALVIVGSRRPGSSSVVQLDASGVSVCEQPDLRGAVVSQTVATLRRQWGDETELVGVGPAGERLLPLASTFGSYPAGGSPVYHVGRNRLGRVFGGLGLKAVAVTAKRLFAATVVDSEAIYRLNKQLGRLVATHPICGGALPAYGSITLIKLLRAGQDLTSDHSPVARRFVPGLNRACAPGCVIGCLNRHAASATEAYSSPAESEVRAGCEHLLGIADTVFARELNRACFEQGLDSLEFVASAALLCRAERLQPDQELIRTLLQEVTDGQLRGRLLGLTTAGLQQVYADLPQLEELVTRPAVREAEQFDVGIPHRAVGLDDLSDLEYLHSYLLASENLGLCLFTAFAVLDDAEGQSVLADLVAARIGRPVSVMELIQAGRDCLCQIAQAEAAILTAGCLPRVPEFVKVLYRYLQRRS